MSRLDHPSTHRNRDPIARELLQWLPAGATVLEIASGTGQHAAHFAALRPDWTWIPSDPGADERASVAAWCEGLGNVAAPLAIDVSAAWPALQVDAVFCSNLIHIAPWPCTEALMRGARSVLTAGGRLVTYGPYRIGGSHTAPSNAAFDESLRERDPRWGVRDLEAVAAAASAEGLRLIAQRPMPANNQLLVFEVDA